MSDSLPPGPRIPSPVQSMLLAKRPVAFLQTCRRRFGRAFTLTAAPLGRAVYVWDPRDIRAIFRGDPEVFRVAGVREAHKLVMGPKSLLLQDGERHLHDRKMMSPQLHGAHLQDYHELVTQAVEREVATWPLGVPFALRPRLHLITLDVIVRVVFGTGGDQARLVRMRDALADLFEVNPTLVVAVPAVRHNLGPWSPWGKFVRVRRAVDDLIDEEILRQRRSERREGVLGVLVEGRDEEGRPLTDDHIHDQLMTLLLAGQETTASALAWAFERLTHNREAYERLVSSLDAGEDDYLQAVIQETLRARPILSVTPRWLGVDTDITGRRLPAGTVLCIAALLTQWNAEEYPEPERFVPERFLGKPADPTTFVAFGGGIRRCMGAALSQVEMSTVLRMVLERFELRASRSDDERITTHHITLTPARGAEVVALRRHRARDRTRETLVTA